MKKLTSMRLYSVAIACIFLYLVAAAPTYSPDVWDPGMYKATLVPNWHIPATDSVKAAFKVGLTEFYDKQEYIDSLMVGFHLAKLMEARYEIPWGIILAQWTLESAGKMPDGSYMPGRSRLARLANNHFGIKKGKRDRLLTRGEYYGVLSPEEDKKGKRYHKNSRFAKFKTRFDGVSCHSLLLRSTYINGSMLGNPWHIIPRFETEHPVNTSWVSGATGEKIFDGMWRWETHILALRGFDKKYATDNRYYAKIHTLAEKFYTAAGELSHAQSTPVNITTQFQLEIVESLKNEPLMPEANGHDGE